MITVEALVKKHQALENRLIHIEKLDRYVAQKMVRDDAELQEQLQTSRQLKLRHYLARKRYEQSHYAQVG